MNEISQKEADRRRNISESLRGRKRPAAHILRIANSNRGKKRTKEQNEANSERAVKFFSNPENRKMASVTSKKSWCDPERRKAGVAANLKTSKRKDVKEKISKSMKKVWENKEYKEKMSNAHIGQKTWNKGIPWTEEYRKNVISAINKPSVLKIKAKKSKALWKDENYIKKIQASYHCKPNKPEKIILNILNKDYPGEWKYTGDFSFIINGKSPDFVNCNGKKLIIEMFGDYWHKGEDPQDRANIFKPFGYETLVIWESELKNINNVTLRIHNFMERQK